MGYAVLYIAFGIVALWLLGEVLLQFKARLRWRLLAFAGFMGVAGGVALRNVIVIVLGAIAFGAGQALVTLSHRRGFSTGWALGGRPGSSRRRRSGAVRPALEVTPVEEDGRPIVSPEDAEVLAARTGEVWQPYVDVDDVDVFQPVPMRDDSGEYPLYDGQSSYTPDPYTSGGYEGYGAQGYAGWGGEPQPAEASYRYDEAPDQSGWDTGGRPRYDYEQPGYQDQQQTAFGYGYETGSAGAWQGEQGRPAPHEPAPHEPAPHEPAPHEPAPHEPAPSEHGYAEHGYAEQPYYQQPPPQQAHNDPYGYGYPYQQEQQQPYIPQQQNQSPYDGGYDQPYGESYGQGYDQASDPGHDQRPPHEGQPPHEQPQPPQPQYADPYDPYRY